MLGSLETLGKYGQYRRREQRNRPINKSAMRCASATPAAETIAGNVGCSPAGQIQVDRFKVVSAATAFANGNTMILSGS